MKDNYLKAYKEVIEILKYLPKESIEKIPQSMIETFKIKMDKDYEFIVDTSKGFEEQKLLEETKAILANIFRDYWATPYQKEIITSKEHYDREKYEELKEEEKYGFDNVFKNREKNLYQKDKTENLPVEIKKEKFYQKIINFLKKYFLHE